MKGARTPAASVHGVTLIELVVVIVITSILAVMMGYFVYPILQYADVARRADMTDIADTAVRRFSRDLRLALPNSVRVSADQSYLEFLLVRTGGRYRTDSGAAGSHCPGGASEDPLKFGVADGCFKTLGRITNDGAVASTDYIVVYNLPPGTDNADAYQNGAANGGNKSLVSSLTIDGADNSDLIAMASSTFTYESPAARFHIVERPVTYACTGGELRRYASYAISAGPAANRSLPPVPSGSSSLVADHISGCTFTYVPNSIAGSDGLVTLVISVQTTDARGIPETVSLYYAFHVSNLP